MKVMPTVFLCLVVILMPLASSVWWNPFTWFSSGEVPEGANLSNIGIQSTGQAWTVTHASGVEAQLRLWTANAKDKKTEIGFLPPNNNCVGWTDKLLYDEAGAILDDKAKQLDDKAKQITLKCESAKCDGLNCYHISLTDAQAINIDDNMKLGDASFGIEYQDQNLINYDLGFANMSISLTDNTLPDAVNDIWITQNEDNYKFGANHTGMNETELHNFTYTIESTQEIKLKGWTAYLVNPIRQTSKFGKHEIHEQIKFNDVCKRGFEPYNFTDEELNITSIQYNKTADCDFELWDITYGNDTIYYLNVSFLSDKYIDPTITNITADASFDNVRCEGETFCHLSISDENVTHYFPFDVNNDTAIIYDWSNKDNNPSSVVGGRTTYWTASGKFGGGWRFNDDAGIADSMIVPTTGMTTASGSVCTWVNPVGDHAPSNYAYYFQHRTGSNNNRIYMYFDEDDSDTINFGFGSSAARDSNPACSFTDGTWVHTCIVWNATGYNGYCNGVEVVKGSDTLTGINSVMGIGNAGVAPNEGANCIVDEFMAFNKTLSPTEVGQIYNQSYPRFAQTGNHTLNYTIASGDNRVNISLNISNDQFYSSFNNLSVSVWDGDSWEGNLNMTNGVNNTFTISASATQLNLSMNYTSNASRFWSPILLPPITYETFTAGGEPAVDKAPVVTINNPLNQSYNVTTLIFNTTATDAETYVDNCSLSYNGGANNYTLMNLTTSPTQWALINTSVAQGVTNATFYCNDSNSNVTQKSVMFYIDSIAPVFPSANGIPPNWSVAYGIKLVTDFNATDSGVGVDGASWRTNNTVEFQINNTGGLTNKTTLASSTVYVINVSVNDTLGNINSTLWQITIGAIIDTTPPVFVIKPANATINHGQNFTVYYNASDETQFGNYSLNDTRFVIYPNGTVKNTTSLSARTYLINVSINDTSSNENSTLYKLIVSQNNTLVLGLSATSPLTYPTISDFTGSGCPTELVCSLNITNSIFSAGTRYANYSTAGNDNFTATSTVTSITINQGVSEIDMKINGSDSDFQRVGNQSGVWINTTNVTGAGTIEIYVNGVLNESNASNTLKYQVTWTVGDYNVSAKYTGTSNWTTVWDNIDVNISAPTPDTPPVWFSISNYTHTANTTFSETVSATDDTGISGYHLNDTTYFNITRTTGLITNNTRLTNVTTYWLNLSVNDTLNQWNSTIFYISVTELITYQYTCNVTYSGLRIMTNDAPYVKLCEALNFD